MYHIALSRGSALTMCLTMLCNESSAISAVSAPREHMYTPPIIATSIKNKWELIEKTGGVSDKGSWYMSTPLAPLIWFRSLAHVPICIVPHRLNSPDSKKEGFLSLCWEMRQSQGSGESLPWYWANAGNTVRLNSDVLCFYIPTHMAHGPHQAWQSHTIYLKHIKKQVGSGQCNESQDNKETRIRLPPMRFQSFKTLSLGVGSYLFLFHPFNTTSSFSVQNLLPKEAALPSKACQEPS